MLGTRIKTGFHRIGLVIAVVIGVPSIGSMLMSLPIAMGWIPESWRYQPSQWPEYLFGGAVFLAFGLFGDLAAWTLGWIIAGFAGGEENSN
jgi:hypothetical protein